MYVTMIVFIRLSGSLIVFTMERVQAVVSAKPSPGFFNSLCTLICLTISFLLISDTAPPSSSLPEHYESQLHRPLTPIHRHFHIMCLVFP